MKNIFSFLAVLTLTMSFQSVASDEVTNKENLYNRTYIAYQALDDSYSEYNGLKVGFVSELPSKNGVLLGGEFSYNKSSNTYYDATLIDLNFNAGFDVVTLVSDNDFKIVPYVKAGFGSYKEDYGFADISDFGFHWGLGVRYLGSYGLYIDASMQKQSIDVMNLDTVDIKWTGLSIGWSF